MAEPFDWHPERYRALLQLQVRLLRPDPRFRRRFDSSDLVQEALLKAHQGKDQFRGTTEAELVRWLQQILKRVLISAAREATAGKRDLRLEQSLEDAVEQSSARLEDFLTARGPSPGGEAERRELRLRWAAALDQLPDDQRDVVLRRDFSGDSVKQIAAETGRTEKAVAGLLLRGRRKLAGLLADYR
jgi:RNA polymerase sigma-70 factor (ECF subfamily)